MKSDWRDNEIAGKFLTGIRAALPLAATQLDLMARITREFCAEVKTFLDLGCGDGIIGRYIHDHYPEATGIYVDYSETMIAELRKKVKYNSQILTEDYSQDQWMTLVEKKKPFDLVVSGYSIHHLSHESKGILYQRIYGLLKPGGLFLNLDHVASPTPQIEKLFDDLFIDSLAEFQKGAKPREAIREEYLNRRDKILNILAPVEEQCLWLKKIGFEQVDCFFKIYELALFGGIKPSS